MHMFLVQKCAKGNTIPLHTKKRYVRGFDPPTPQRGATSSYGCAEGESTLSTSPCGTLAETGIGTVQRTPP